MLVVKALKDNPGLLVGSLDVEAAITLKLQNLFPDLPMDILGRIVPDLSLMKSQDYGAVLPWNRRKRKRLAKARHVVLHIFSGPDHRFWEQRLSNSKTEVLCLDLQGPTKANLLDASVFSYVLAIAASGRLRCLIGGPPCRTVSALRYQGDNGPPVLRTPEHPYGLPQLAPVDFERVYEDVTLWFRFLTIYVVAEEVRREPEPPTGLVLEQPEDPANYRSPEDVKRFGYMSAFRTKEWQAFQAKFNVKMCHFDQATMGHQRRKPTTLALVGDDLLQLDGMRGSPPDAQQQAEDFQALSMDQGCQTSRTWAAWAPGLKEAIVVAVQLQLQRRDEELSLLRQEALLTAAKTGRPVPDDELQRPSLCPLGAAALEQWRQHFLHDHYPSRRDCAVCLRSQGRSRPHRRVQHADAFTLSIDLSGRMTPGKDQGGKRAKYMTIACYTMPVSGDGKPLLQPPGAEAGHDVDDVPLPPADAPIADEMEAGGPVPEPQDLHDEDFAAEGLPLSPPMPLPGEDFEADLDEQPDPQEQQPAQESPAEAAAKSAYDTWHRLVEEASNVGVCNLTFVETLESRNSKHIVAAIAKIYCRLRSLGLPLLRLHTDRAKELIGTPVRQWTMARGIAPTMTSGNSFKTNGRAEAEVNNTKRAVRAILDAGQVDLQDWPLVARHAGERRLRHQLSRIGWPAAPLLRFGSKAFALKKSWKDRCQDWRNIREKVQIMGPAENGSLTTPSYYVKSLENGRFFYTDDVVLPAADVPDAAADEPILYLTERGAAPAALTWDNPPTHRLRGKQTVPFVSMLHIEGECEVVRRCPLFFEPSDVIPAAVQQPGRKPAMLQLVEATAYDSGNSGSSDSWTLASPSGFSGEEELGGGDVEGVPNNRCGGSSPVTPIEVDTGPKAVDAVPDLPRAVEARKLLLCTLQHNLSEYVIQEMEQVDASSEDQAWWFPTLADAVLKKIQAEEELLQIQRHEEHQLQQALENEFLVTKTIGQQEVWSDLEAWTPSIKKEYDQLVNKKQAVQQVTREELRTMAEEAGLPIELLPGKMVHTRKAVTGDYRSRAVVCGNYSEATNAECYAGGADGVQIRATIKTTAMKGWKMAATDIRVAFLNAPRRDQTKIVAMEIPKVFRKINCAGPQHVWVIRKALYGLTTSPRDWGLHRNEELPKIKWQVLRENSTWNGSFKATADENLWRLEEQCAETGEVRWSGLLSVYGDDLLVGGEEDSIKAALGAVGQLWSIADVEWAEVDKPLKFCGFEISADPQGDGFHVSQRRYEQEMLQRYGITEGTDYPLFKTTEEDDVPCENPGPEQLRKAQAIAGSLLWLTTRTRPDILHGVASMSRLMSKNPARALQIGNALLKYVFKVPGGLHFSGKVRGWGARDQPKVQRHSRLLEMYSDISYAAGSGHKSIEGVIGFFAGTPLVWQSHQQPFATHPTAEAELVSYCESLIAGRSLEALLCTIWNEPLPDNSLQRVLYGDNLAAIGLAQGTANSSWRTRHLRIRASVLKEALDPMSSYPGGQWSLLHLKGAELVADGLTKPLMGQAFDRFLQDLGMVRVTPSKREDTGGHGLGVPQVKAMVMMLIGCSLITQAEAAPPDEREDINLDWLGALALMVLGAIYVGQIGQAMIGACLRRLRASWSFNASNLDLAGSGPEQAVSTASSSAGPEQALSFYSEQRCWPCAGRFAFFCCRKHFKHFGS